MYINLERDKSYKFYPVNNHRFYGHCKMRLKCINSNNYIDVLRKYVGE